MAVVTNAGGPGILATDAIAGLGMEMAALAPATAKALRKVLPPEASVHNPIDLIASADAACAIARRCAWSPRTKGIDGLVVLFVSPIMIDAAAVAQAIVDETRGHLTKPVLACVMGRQRGDEALQILSTPASRCSAIPRTCATTLRLMCRRQRGSNGGREASDAARRQEGGRARLPPQGTVVAAGGGDRTVLQAYGDPVRAEPARAFGRRRGRGRAQARLPGRAEGRGCELLHKSEHRAVRTGLRTGDEVFAAAQDLLERLGQEFAACRCRCRRTPPGTARCCSA
jgi:acyl-CoA synthetase (NDP forming)